MTPCPKAAANLAAVAARSLPAIDFHSWRLSHRTRVHTVQTPASAPTERGSAGGGGEGELGRAWDFEGRAWHHKGGIAREGVHVAFKTQGVA